MTDELVAYLLDDLCPERRAEVERRLQSDAAWRGELERLRECLAATGDPARCVDEPPQDLVRKTCCFVERVGAAPAPAAAGLTPAAARSCSGSHWSLADVTVGGGVLLTLGMLMLPAMRESRDAARRTVCENNLRVLSSALFDYQNKHGHRLPRVAPGESSGQFVLQLVESGVISRETLADAMVCPDSKLADDRFAGRVNWHIPSRQELDAAQGDERRQLVVLLGGSYAFNCGYVDRDQTYHEVQYTGDTDEPVMADAPRISSSGVRSANHGGRGQYVMFQGHCVKFRANSDLAVDVDNIFLNQDGEHAAGRDRWDVVLIKSSYGPAGRLD